MPTSASGVSATCSAGTASRAGDSWQAVDFSPIAWHDKEFNCFVAAAPIVFVLIWAGTLDKGDWRWKRETEFLSVFLAALPKIFNMFIFTHLLKLNQSVFNLVQPHLI
ncbi:hypothetical protein QUB70_01550 [Microcoleus sp. A003_D6]|uniref:hypothetical protein n=1 Tax=Microcoleus sp. A003_D6 TaxID=3055266 RepID=UPI002FD6D325